MTFDFEIHDTVNIIPIDLVGRITGIWFDDKTVKYEVRFFKNADAKFVYFYTDEIKLHKDTPPLGIK